MYSGKYQQQLVAIKTLKGVAGLNPKAMDQFMREAAVMQNLNHPCIIHVRSLDKTE